MFVPGLVTLEVAVALTFDVDGEDDLACKGLVQAADAAVAGPLRPDAGYGRILDLLRNFNMPGTFYVPGHTADHHPEAVAAIAAARTRGRPPRIPAPRHQRPGCQQPARRARGRAGRAGPGPASCLAGATGHWPYFGWTPYHGGLLADPAAVERIWLEEYESARQDHRAITYTMHPEAIGRGYLLRLLRRVITGMLSRGHPGPPPTPRSPPWRTPRLPREASPAASSAWPEPHAGTVTNQQRSPVRAGPRYAAGPALSSSRFRRATAPRRGRGRRAARQSAHPGP